MSNNMYQQIAETYQRMTDIGFHPSIEAGWNGSVDEDLLNPEKEVNSYIEGWVPDEEKMSYWAGCPDFDDRPALIFVIEAARQLNAVERGMAVKLLRMAIDDIEARGPSAFEIRAGHGDWGNR